LTGHTPLALTNEHKSFGIKIYKLCDKTGYSYNIDNLFFPWESKEISHRDSWILMKDLLEKTAQACRLQQHSTGVGLFRFVMKQPKCLMCTASGVKRKVFGKVWQKYDVWVARWRFWDYHAKAQFH
jgi:hypothetical protein